MSLETDLAMLATDVALLHQVVHGGETETVLTSGGEIKTVANAIRTIGAAQLPWAYSSSYASLTAAIAAIGSSPTWLVINSTTTLTANTTIPSNISVTVGMGNTINQGAYTLAINGPFEAPLVKVFTGTGKVSGLTISYPEWFETNTTPGTTNMTTAIQAAINSVDSGVVYLNDLYLVSALQLLNKSAVTIMGVGTVKSSNGAVPTFHLTGCQDVFLEHFNIRGRFDVEGPTGMEPTIRIDPNLVGATQVNKNIGLNNLSFKYNPLNAVFLAGDSTTYGALSGVRITNCRMDQGLCFLLATGVKDVSVSNIDINHSSAIPVNPGLAQDEDIAFFSDNSVSCENIHINNIRIQGNGTVSNIYTGRPKLSFGISTAGLKFTNLSVTNISVKDNLGNFTPSFGSEGSTCYITDANADRLGFVNAQFIGLNFYNSPGIFIQANNLRFMGINLDTFPSIASFAGFGRAIDSTTAVSTKGCEFIGVSIKHWNAGDPCIYTAEGGVRFKGLEILDADGAVWAAPNCLYDDMVLDDVGETTHGSFWCQGSTVPFVLNNPVFKNAPYTALKDNIAYRAQGCVMTGATFTNNAIDTTVDPQYWQIFGITGVPTYADNAAALAGGLIVGDWYITPAKVYQVVV